MVLILTQKLGVCQTQPVSRLPSDRSPSSWSRASLRGGRRVLGPPSDDVTASLAERRVPLVVWRWWYTGARREGKVLYCTFDCPFWTKSTPVEEAPAPPAPEIKSFTIKTTQMKCHGKSDRNQEGVKPILGEGGRGGQGDAKPKGTGHAWWGRERRHRSGDDSVTEGQEPSGPALRSSEASDV